MISRKHIDELAEIGGYFPVIGIVGPRQVGKTTLVKAFMKTLEKPAMYLDMEKPSDFQKLNEAEHFFAQHESSCLIIDEIQRRPELFPLIRAAVDENRIPMRFILLGSASPDLLRGTSESLAGRISYVRMHPFSLVEVGQDKPVQLHFRGGFPDACLAPTDRMANRWLDDFIGTYIERDLPLLGLPASPVTTRRLWEMLAWQNANLLNASAFGNSLGLTYHTINKYLEFIEGAFMFARLLPYSVNLGKRLVKTPKGYITDTGVLHRLLRVNSYDDLMGMPILGASFEAFVFQNIMAHKPEDVDVSFYRTHAGAEVDFVFTRASKVITTAEAKFSTAPKLAKGTYIAMGDLGAKQNYVIVPDSDPYQLKEGITVCGVHYFLKNVLGEM